MFIILTFYFSLFAQNKEFVQLDFIDVNDVHLERELIERSHEIIEGIETDNFFQNWKEGFRFGKKIKDGYRWVSLHQGSQVKDLALDSIMLFGLSHGVEMSSGPILVGMGLSHGWPEWLVSALGLAGATISVPGLDPLCIIIFATYSKSPSFRKQVRKLRFAVIKGVRTLSDVFGISQLLQRHFYRVPGYISLLHKQNLKSVTLFNHREGLYTFEFTRSGKRLAEVQFRLKEGESFLHKAYFNLKKITPIEDKGLDKFIRQFGWNVGDALKEAKASALRAQDLSKDTFYVERTLSEGLREQTHIFTAQSVKISSRLKFSFSRPSCRRLFAN